MKARARELKAEERASKNRAEGERAVLAAIEAMTEPDRAMAKRLHAIIEATAPDLWPKTWYGMPAYAKDGYHSLGRVAERTKATVLKTVRGASPSRVRIPVLPRASS